MTVYRKVSGGFWIGATGRLLRGDPETQVVALYLLTGPHANMLGMYYIAIPTLAHETGLTIEGAWKGLRRAVEAGFCSYDEASEYVWVHEMARYQIGDELTANDKRVPGIERELLSVAKCPFARAFYERYREPFKLRELALPEVPSVGLGSPIEAPSEGLGSQEQEQEQEQEPSLRSGGALARSQPQGGASSTRSSASADAPRPKRLRRGKLWHTVPDDFALSEADLQYGRDEGFTDDELRREERRWRNHEYRDPRSDASRAWRKWISNAAEYRRRHGPLPGRGQNLTAAEKTADTMRRAWEDEQAGVKQESLADEFFGIPEDRHHARGGVRRPGMDARAPRLLPGGDRGSAVRVGEAGGGQVDQDRVPQAAAG